MTRARVRWTIFAVALGIRVAAISWRGPDVVGFGDAQDYLATASQVCREHAYPDRTGLPFFRAPLLPFFIAATTLCNPERIVLVKLALAVCDAATALVIGEIAWLLFGSMAAAALGALLAALDPLFIASVCDVRSEPLFMLFLTTAIWFFLRACRDGTAASALGAGAACALAALTRPAGLVALVFAGLAWLFVQREKRPPWPPLAALAAGATLVLLPWIVRNAIRYHELIVVNDAAGYNFWRGSHPELERISRITDAAAYRRATVAFEEEVTASAARSIEARAHSPLERSRAWFAAGFLNIERDPRQAMAYAVRRAWWYWRPWLNPQEHTAWAVAGSAILNVALFAFAAVGLARTWRREPRVAGGVVSFFVVMWLAHVPYQVVMRFRIPFTDPLMIVFAASAIVHVLARPRRKVTSARPR
jgi:4-amino-4-deoxy-L-arabinose transferase-like glycosyltransferase